MFDKKCNGSEISILTVPKAKQRRGAAATARSYTETVSLSSILTAEYHVIHFALNSAKANTRRKFAIFTDSRICVYAYETNNNKTKSV